MIANKFKKSKLITSALLGYYSKYGLQELDINIKFEDDILKIDTIAKLSQLPTYLQELEDILNSKQSDDLEFYYAELLEEADGRTIDINLLSALVDKGKVKHSENTLEIYIEKLL